MEPEDFGPDGELEEIIQQEEEEKKLEEEPPKVFQCTCGKTYMSYSALYSHNKQKHGGEPTNLPSGRGGRKRGRPPKSDSVRTRPKPPHDMNEDDSYFRDHKLMGGPVDPRLSLAADSPLYSLVNNLMQKTEKLCEETASCNETFAAYLIEMGKKLTSDGQAQATEFIEKLKAFLTDKEGEEFCDNDSPQSLPERANTFVTEYLETCPSETLDRATIIELMMHFCRWLFVHHYSNLKLSLSDKD